MEARWETGYNMERPWKKRAPGHRLERAVEAGTIVIPPAPTTASNAMNDLRDAGCCGDLLAIGVMEANPGK